MRRHHSELQNEEVHTPGVARQRLALEMARAPHPDMRIQAGALGITRLQGVFSNLFPIQIAATSSNQTPVYHQYAVDFTMEDQSVPLGRVPMKIRHMWFGQALKELLSREVRQGFKLAAFDGSSFFTSHKLPVHPSQAQQQQQQEQQECLRATVRDNKRNARISVTVTYVGELSRERMSASHGQMLNIVYNNALELMGWERIGRNYYNVGNKSRIDLRRGVRGLDRSTVLEIIRGAYAQVKMTETGLFLNVDFKQRLMRNTSVLDRIRDIAGKYRIDLNQVAEMSKDDRRGTSIFMQFEQEVSKELVGKIVHTSYDRTRRGYRVVGVHLSLTPATHTFSFSPRGPGGTAALQQAEQVISVAEYIQRVHGVRLSFANAQPLLEVKIPRRRQKDIKIMLAPECCAIIDTWKGGLVGDSFKQMNISPSKRFEETRKHINTVLNHKRASTFLDRCAVTVQQSQLVQNVFRLPLETLHVGDGRSIAVKESNAMWQNIYTGSNRLFHPVEMRKWVLLAPRNNDREIKRLANDILRVAQNLGVPIAQPRILLSQSVDARDMIRTLQNAGITHENTHIVLIVGPPGNSCYPEMKLYLTTSADRVELNSQYVQLNNLGKPGIASQLLVSMQIKLSGKPWRVQFPFGKRNNDNVMMAIGIDISHSQKHQGHDSFGAFVASMNKELDEYYSKTFRVPQGEEVVDNIGRQVVKALEKFKSRNEFYPAGIIVYRDGVSDGQMKEVLDKEVTNIKESINRMLSLEGSQNQIGLCYIIVTKRVSQRFFVEKNGRIENPPHGTVVDSQITSNDMYEFYLISYSVGGNGCAKPVKYTVLYSDMERLQTSRIAILSYKFCHAYFNYPVSIRVPAPLMYAHKLSEFACQCLRGGEESESLSTSLYYL